MSRARGAALAVSWLTVLPVPVRGAVDRVAGGRALRWAPLVGLGLGGLAAAALLGLRVLGAPALLAAVLVLALLALATRGMHLDGLADTADGLGCYGSPARALDVMRDGGAGPFAVVTLVLVLAAQASALAALAGTGRWVAVLLAVAAGRVAFGWCCRRGVPAARPSGLGALVAGTQHPAVPLGWSAALAVAALAAVPARPWQGPVAVLLATAAVALLSRHCARRFGGITGDTLGATCETATTAVLVLCALG